MCSVLVMEHSL